MLAGSCKQRTIGSQLCRKKKDISVAPRRTPARSDASMTSIWQMSQNHRFEGVRMASSCSRLIALVHVESERTGEYS